MSVRLVHWRPAHKPIPKGWRKARQRKNHHHRHSVLTEAERRPPKQTEAQLHVQVADYLRKALRSPDVWWTTIPAGGGGRIRGALLKRKGYMAGTPDILIVFHGMAYWIELKATKGGLSDVQIGQHGLIIRAGSVVATCRTMDEVHQALCQWGLPVKAKPT